MIHSHDNRIFKNMYKKYQKNYHLFLKSNKNKMYIAQSILELEKINIIKDV